ncbi:lipoprotein 17-related variable surface protein [Metamycoplasma hyosynoviae]|uniref:lipoprotein 17-related variable surface protein n=1 Tax=Metamycoplasma hyosynoviae TaxID=29559 RepID=UPI002359105F|nr:lipoprotein 17-related variable surface protein [Metamycoplasma hyosynoviae]MDC8927222.1 lipoprotein 17-related variable surface protein [Metamycoplasma hyosynoviae]
MTKQSKIILLSSLITPPTCIPLLAISCANQDPANEIKKVKVSITSLDKFAKDVVDADIKITDYSPSVFTATQTHQVSSEDPTTLEVLVELKNNKKGTKATKLFTIKGFKADPTDEIKDTLNKEIEKISGVSVENHTNKLVNTITTNDVKVTETTPIDKSVFEYLITLGFDSKDRTKLKVTIRLKHKQSGFISKVKKEFEITGFKNTTPEEEQQLKNLENASKKVTVDVEGKENKFAKDVEESELKFTIPTLPGLIDDPTKYEIIEKSWSINKDDSRILEIYFRLKHKETGLVSNKRKLKVEGFKEAEASTPEEKALQDALNAVTLSYDGGEEALKKLDAGDLKIDKVKLDGKKEGFEYTTKFKNENATKDNYNNGYRTIVITVKKDSKSLSREFKLECFKSDYDVIIKQREKVKTIDLMQTSETKEVVESMFSGSQDEVEIFYDFTGKTYFNKKYTETDKKPILDMSAITWAHNTIFGKGKLKKTGENKYKAYVTLAKSYKVNNQWNYIYDNRQLETKELSFEIIDQAALDKIAEENKNNFDYPEKQTITVDQVTQDKIKLPEVKIKNIPIKFNITSLQKDAEHSKLIVKYQAEIDYQSKKITSKEVQTEIVGFKENTLGKEFVGLTVDYENKSSTEVDSVQEDQFKLKKNGSDYTPTSGITKEIKIVSKDKYKGTVTVVVTLKKDTDSASKEFVVEDFKKKNFDFNTEADNSFELKLEGIDKPNTLPSVVNQSNVKVTIKDEYKSAISLEKIELEPNNTNGTLKIKITLKDLINNPNTIKVVEKEESGFKNNTAPTKDYKLPELYPLSESGQLIKVDESQRDSIIQSFENMDPKSSGRRYLAYKSGAFYTKGTGGTKIEGISISDESLKNKVLTHGGKYNIAKDADGDGSIKGIALTKEENKWIARWRLVLSNNKIDDKVYEQILFQ